MGGIYGLLHCSVEELCAIPGVGPAKAAQLKAAVEVGKACGVGSVDDRNPHQFQRGSL